ncbi:MAG: hypothetical protein AAGA20_11660 [Planctomycetota bacterium]
MEGRTTRCIECGGFVDSLNEDENGNPCPYCAERLLETLPGIFHRPWMHPWDASGSAEDVEVDEFLAEEPGDVDDPRGPRTSFRPFDEGEPDLPA